MNAVSNEKRLTLIAFYIRPTGTQISRGFKVHNVITCESKVQVVVSLGRHWVLFALGCHWDLTNGTWHVLLQSGNVFELGGITILFKSHCQRVYFPQRTKRRFNMKFSDLWFRFQILRSWTVREISYVSNTHLQILRWLSSKYPGLGIWEWTISFF